MRKSWFFGRTSGRETQDSSSTHGSQVGQVGGNGDHRRSVSYGDVLIRAIDDGESVERVRELLEGGISIHHSSRNPDLHDGSTALHVASAYGRVELVQLLLKLGADVLVPEKRRGWTPLHLATSQCQDRHLVILRILIDHVRDNNGDEKLIEYLETPTKGADGLTALHIAAGYGFDEGVPLLLDAGANINSRTTVKESTPLHLACTFCKWSVVRCLLGAGADKNAQDKDGKTPWERLPSESHTDDSLGPLLMNLRPSSSIIAGNTIALTPPPRAPTTLQDCRQRLRDAFRSPGSTDPVELTDEYVQTCVGEFIESNELGRGAFGVVYRGYDQELDLEMAIKKVSMRIPSQVALDAVQLSFRREVAALKRFRHPNIVILYGYNLQVNAEDNFLVYEYAPRGSLDKYLRDEKGRTLLSGALKRLNIMLEIAQALHFLHTGGCDGWNIMHRDLKPGNICLTEEFSAKLIDCGVAKFVRPENDDDNNSLDPTILLPSDNARFGTKGYICPAYALGEIPEFIAACDIYSFGVIMVELVRGELQGDSSRQGSTIAQRYVSRHQVPVLDGWRLLMADADETTSEWNADALESVCRAAVLCMSPDPNVRPKSSRLIDELSDAVQLQFNADNPITESEPSLLDDEELSYWSGWSNRSDGRVPCVVCNKRFEGVICEKGHSICSPCMSSGMMFRAGCMGSVKCPMEGCGSTPFTDAQLCGKVTQRAYEVYKSSREGQQLIDDRLRNMENDLREIKGSLQNMESVLSRITTDVRRCLRAMASFSSETFNSCPGLVWLVPADKSAKLRQPLDWASDRVKKRYLLYFICQHSFEKVMPPLEIEVSKGWLAKVAPVLKVSLFVIKTVAIAYGLPLPFRCDFYADRINLGEQFVSSLLDTGTEELLNQFTPLQQGGRLHESFYQVQKLLGESYEFVAQVAKEAKNSAWKKVMAPAINKDGTSIWVKAQYKDLY